MKILFSIFLQYSEIDQEKKETILHERVLSI